MALKLEKNQFSDKTMSVAEAAYVAAFIDGEGTIALALHRHGGERRSATVIPIVTAANTRLELLRALVQKTGNGRIDSLGDNRTDRKVCYKWCLSANQIRNVLPQVEPYLEGKRRQAQIVLEFLSLREQRPDGSWSRGWRDADLPKVEALYNEIRSLNARGKCIAGQFSLAIGDGKERDRICSVEGCDDRRYAGNEYCYEHWRQRQPAETRVCEYCGEAYESRETNKGRFCSAKCQYRSWEKRVGRRDQGEEVGKYRRLLDEERAEIRDLWRSGERDKVELARAYGVDRTTIAIAVKDLDQTRTAKCERCGKEFECERSTAKFCSRACTRKTGWDRRATCARCGKEFERHHHRATYCDECCSDRKT